MATNGVVRSGMFAGRIVAATDVSAYLAEAQMDPIPTPGRNTFLTSVGGDNRRGKIGWEVFTT